MEVSEWYINEAGELCLYDQYGWKRFEMPITGMYLNPLLVNYPHPLGEGAVLVKTW